MSTRHRFVSLGLIALLSACNAGTAPEPGVVGPAVSVQRVRTSWHADGTYVAIGVLVTGNQGQAVDCDNAVLETTVEWSDQGGSGPWTAIDGGSVVTECTQGVGADVALVVDNSGSENGFVPDLQAASADMLEGVLANEGSASLVRVSTNSEVISGLTADGAPLYTGLDDMFVDGGWTALWDGVRMGNETLGSGSALGTSDLGDFCQSTGRVGVVAFTDGQDNNSDDVQDYDHEKYPGDGLSTRLEDLFNMQAGAASTPVYAIGLGNEVDTGALQTLADTTGGRYQHISDPSQLSQVFETLGDYFSADQQVCADVPVGVCGPLWLKVSWSLRWRSWPTRRWTPAMWRNCKTLSPLLPSKARRLPCPRRR